MAQTQDNSQMSPLSSLEPAIGVPHRPLSLIDTDLEANGQAPIHVLDALYTFLVFHLPNSANQFVDAPTERASLSYDRQIPFSTEARRDMPLAPSQTTARVDVSVERGCGNGCGYHEHQCDGSQIIFHLEIQGDLSAHDAGGFSVEELLPEFLPDSLRHEDQNTFSWIVNLEIAVGDEGLWTILTDEERWGVRVPKRTEEGYEGNGGGSTEAAKMFQGRMADVAKALLILAARHKVKPVVETE